MEPIVTSPTSVKPLQQALRDIPDTFNEQNGMFVCFLLV